MSVPLQISNYLLHYKVSFKQIFFLVTVELIEYIFAAVSVCSNAPVGPYPRTNMSFFILSIWEEELTSAPKIDIFWPDPPPGNENLDLLSNPLPQP